MKKTYIIPALTEQIVETDALLISTSGDAGITPADPSDPIPGEADVKRNDYNVWDEDWSR